MTRLKEHFRWNWDDGWQPKRPTVERLTVRLTDRTFRALDALALERGVTRTGLVKNNRELWARCNAIADEAGAGGFVALDLALAFHNPANFATLMADPEPA